MNITKEIIKQKIFVEDEEIRAAVANLILDKTGIKVDKDYIYFTATFQRQFSGGEGCPVSRDTNVCRATVEVYKEAE